MFCHILDVAVVSFCKDTKSEGSRINMVLFEKDIPEQGSLECECWVEVDDSRGYVWNVQDLKLNQFSKVCYSNHSTSEATSLCINDSNMEDMKTVEKFSLSRSVFTLKFQRTAIPEMVWLQVKGNDLALINHWSQYI